MRTLFGRRIEEVVGTQVAEIAVERLLDDDSTKGSWGPSLLK